MFCANFVFVYGNNLSSYHLFYSRSDNKDITEDGNENQQSAYSQCKYLSTYVFVYLFVCVLNFNLKLYELNGSHFVPPSHAWNQ